MNPILKEVRELKTGPAELRKFGLLVGGVFCAIGLWLRLKGKPAHPFFWAPGLVLMLLGLAIPVALRQVYLVWMTFAMALGFVVSHVILFLFFFGVIMPIGLFARLMGKDFLRLRLDRAAPSYWIQRDRGKRPNPAEYENQF